MACQPPDEVKRLMKQFLDSPDDLPFRDRLIKLINRIFPPVSYDGINNLPVSYDELDSVKHPAQLRALSSFLISLCLVAVESDQKSRALAIFSVAAPFGDVFEPLFRASGVYILRSHSNAELKAADVAIAICNAVRDAKEGTLWSMVISRGLKYTVQVCNPFPMTSADTDTCPFRTHSGSLQPRRCGSGPPSKRPDRWHRLSSRCLTQSPTTRRTATKSL
jgi:hypothetical protein